MKRAVLAVSVAVVMLSVGASADHVQRGHQAPRARAKTSNRDAPRAVGTTGKASPVQQRLRQDPELARKVGNRLPARIDVNWASSGFRNLGQFVAAVNAADNLDIPFMTLKSRMLDDRMSLGEAIHDLRPSADYRRETRRAETEANAMMRKR